jgi:hypothetical protein
MKKRDHKIATKRTFWKFNSYFTNYIFVISSIYILLSVAIVRGGY